MSSAPPEIRVAALGPVQVFRDGVEVELPGRRPQLMLALLLARADQTVSVTELIALLWADEPPANAVNMLHRYVGEIRRTLQPGLRFRAAGHWLHGVPGGYRLRIDPATCDVLEFRALGQRATTAATPLEASSHWAAALSLWRGPYADGLNSSSDAFAAMNQQRATAALHAAETARRAEGGADLLLPLIQAVAQRNPLDEALAAEVVRLLAAGDRRDEATAWYLATEARLADQLGVGPGAALTATFQSVSNPAQHHRKIGPAQLPPDPWPFGGRRAELDALTRARESFPGLGVIAVDGVPGVGKSTLAVHWAHRIVGRYPDGQLFANLRGSDPVGEPTDPSAVLAGFLDALGVRPPDLPTDRDARAGLFRTRTAGLRLLVVLDDARGLDQVRPLIPAAPGSLVLVTSRTRLSSLAAHEGAVLIGLDRPDAAENTDC